MSLISKTASVDSLVAEMSAALEDKDFRSVFERPVIRTASDESESLEKKASREVTPEVLLETLLATSAHLDELGFNKSAERVLSVAQTLVSEAMEKAKDEDEDEVNDKPSSMDVKPGEGKPKGIDVKPNEGKPKGMDVKPSEGKGSAVNTKKKKKKLKAKRKLASYLKSKKADFDFEEEDDDEEMDIFFKLDEDWRDALAEMARNDEDNNFGGGASDKKDVPGKYGSKWYLEIEPFIKGYERRIYLFANTTPSLGSYEQELLSWPYPVATVKDVKEALMRFPKDWEK